MLIPSALLLASPIVALLAEGVDRNVSEKFVPDFDVVALLAEGVDRNAYPCIAFCYIVVALLAEGVDRNTFLPPLL